MTRACANCVEYANSHGRIIKKLANNLNFKPSWNALNVNQ